MKSIQQYIFLGIAISLLSIAFWLDTTDRTDANLEKYARQIQNYLAINERSILNIFEDKDLIQRLVDTSYSNTAWDDVQKLINEEYFIYLYRSDSLLFWSTNSVVPAIEEVRATSELQFKIVKLNDSRFELVKDAIYIDNQEYILFGLIPIYYEYDIENEHIDNHFALTADIPEKVIINEENKGQVVFNPRGEEIFYLTSTGAFTDYTMRVILLLLYGIGFLFLGAFLNRFSLSLAHTRSPIAGFCFLMVTVLTVRGAMYLFAPLTVFYEIPFFRSTEFVSPIISGSAELFLTVMILLWLVLFFYREVPLKKPTKYVGIRNQLVTFVGYGMIFLGIYWINYVMSELVSMSQVTFDFDNVFELNEFSLLGLLSISILVIALFFLSHKIIPTIVAAKISSSLKLKFGGIILGLLGISAFLDFSSWAIFTLGLFAAFYIWFFEYFIRKEQSNLQFLGWFIFIYSIFIATLLIYHNIQREHEQRIAFADKIITKRNLETEQQFLEIENRLLDADLVRNIKNPLIPTSSIIAAIKRINEEKVYLQENYDFKVYLFDDNGIGIRGETQSYEAIQEMINASDTTLSPNLHFWNNETGYAYIALLPIQIEGRILANIVLRYEPKSIEDLEVYPELLTDRSLAQNTGLDYDYVVYKGGKKIKEREGNYTDKITFLPPKKNGTAKFVNEKGRSYLVYRIDNEQVVIVGRDQYAIRQLFSLLSYVFSFLLIILILLEFLRRTTNIFPKNIITAFTPKPSLHNSIQVSILAIIVLTFLAIAMMTYYYFSNDTEEYHASRLSRKSQGIISSSNYWMKVNKDSLTYKLDVKALSKIHRLDVNLFDNSGQLVTSSQPAIFEKGLNSTQMPPLPFFEMSQKGLKEYTEKEKIGTLEYRSAYLAIKNTKGENVGYLGLPYYSEQGDFQEDMADFIGVLLNVYVLLLVFAFVAAFVTANSITKPISDLKDKIRNVTLGKKNERLEWEKKDEIGVLIEEYNRMLGELEVSANRLATSEREGAWREMAKQVAHEIKNPLTPMKLSIQYLVRVYQSRPEEIGPMLKRVSSTLIEQIDSLARIATEFSNFAKMPEAKNEYININELVSSVYHLFSENDDVKMQLAMPKTAFSVFADKEQLMRVFNNVVKNAIQAIPEDQAGEIDISLEKYDGENIQIKVKDNGCGIPEDKRHSVFVPNFTTKNSGTGLGLAISRKIIEHAGGQIYFTSQENVGTTFFIELPISERAVEVD